VVDIGPGAGVHGGEVIAEGTPGGHGQSPSSLTGKYLSGASARSRCPPTPQANKKRKIKVKGARGNNLKNVDVEIPLGLFTCVTGVSGGGKSTLLIETLYKAPRAS
jgi:excinuclease ABC subunit A